MFEFILSSEVTSVFLILTTLLFLWVILCQKKKYPPGPMSLPLVGNLFLIKKGDILKTFRDLRSKYGDVYSFKLGYHKAVVVNGYEAMKEILAKKGDDTSERPDSFLIKFLFQGEGELTICYFAYYIYYILFSFYYYNFHSTIFQFVTC